MQTAVYVRNRVPHASLANETPYKALYGKDAHLGHLRAIGARAFVHVETHTKTLEHRTSCRLQRRQQVFSSLQLIAEECTREQERHFRRDTFSLA